jgi:large subunit ribosomal protein L24
MRKVRVGDNVIVLCGKDKGKNGKVVKLLWNSNKALIEGINLSTKAVKPTQENPNGGFISKENFINISNISIASPKDGKASRVGIKLVDGKNIRYAKSCGTEL